MDFANIFSLMRPELTLIAIIVIIFVFDLAVVGAVRKWFGALASFLALVQLAVTLISFGEGSCFGGMFITEPIHAVVKSILTMGTFLVFLQSKEWIEREDTSFKLGEFFILTLSTLL